MNNSLTEYYGCPDQFVSLALKAPVSHAKGYFRFGQNILYGKICGGGTKASPTDNLRDVLPDSNLGNNTIHLPFDLTESLNGLRYENYHSDSNGFHPASSLVGKTYYFVRPVLPVELRKYLQRVRLSGWHKFAFPGWPVDRTVDNIVGDLLLMSLKARNVSEIPFIWFWPNGASSCAILTHDVEDTAGRDFCNSLMDIDDAFGVKASFQVVPEERYEIPTGFLEAIRGRGFEINVQDLNHDGCLFRERQEFLSRVEKINEYGKEFQAEGFRSAVLYRRQEWYDALEFSYDMSVPNVAHLDPQRGGCCTVMPYFVGNMVELPVTMTQDYSLFHILDDYSIDLWKQQMRLVMAKHGLMNFIVHPDYIIDQPERRTYEQLLRYLTQLSAEKNIWMPLPREAANWWRERSRMKLVKKNGAWQIEGNSSERARVAYASEKDGQLAFSFESKTFRDKCVKGACSVP